MKRRKDLQNYQKLIAHINTSDFNKLVRVRETSGFKSNYEIMKYVFGFFLKLAYGHDDETELIPEEIERMFYDLGSKCRDLEPIKPQRSNRLLNKQSTGLKKIVIRLGEVEAQQLQYIKEKYSFKSNYEIAQYVALCFIRTAQDIPINDDEDVEAETEAMFYDYSEAEKHFNYAKPKRNMSNKSLSSL